MNKNVEIIIEKNEKEWVFGAKLNDRIYKNAMAATACPKEQLSGYIIQDYQCFIYRVVDDSMDEKEARRIADTIEDIANKVSFEELWTSLLTDNNKPMMPAKMHEIMKERGLTSSVEWYTSLFFVNLGGFITDPPFCYRSIEEDIAAGDCDVIIVK